MCLFLSRVRSGILYPVTSCSVRIRTNMIKLIVQQPANANIFFTAADLCALPASWLCKADDHAEAFLRQMAKLFLPLQAELC